jgi:exodeoxyribonuclease V alpha subunit
VTALDNPESNLITKSGQIDRIVFYSEKDGYIIARVSSEGESFTAVGYLPDAGVGVSYEFTGGWKTHSKYGDQFSFLTFKESIPEGAAQIESFLASGLIRGVGPKVAKAIVAKFGTDTLQIIEFAPERLLEIDGIGASTRDKIAESYVQHKELAEIALYFKQYDISSAAIKKMYQVYGNDTIEKVNADPYRMIEDVKGIGFKTADEIALRMGLEADSLQRIRSGIIFVLRRKAGEGNTCTPEIELLEDVRNLLDVNEDDTASALTELIFDGKISRTRLFDEDVIFLTLYYAAERSICGDVLRLINAPLSFYLPQDAYSRIDAEAAGIEFSQTQKDALRKVISNGVMVITGGPGTGKTTLINTIRSLMTSYGLEVLLAAPTGRAAKRITETTGASASTIHRLLEYAYGEDDEDLHFGRTADNPLECDVLIVDEASMIDVLLMRALLDAIPSGARLIIVGDADQLPAVGAGNVLRDMLDAGVLPSQRLSDVFRQSEGSDIVVGAHAINRGEMPNLSNPDADMILIRQEEQDSIERSILDYVKKHLKDDIQILTPVKKGMLGKTSLNLVLQALLNPPGPQKGELKYGDRIFRTGDRVMQMKNNYRIKWIAKDMSEGDGVFNGDLGYVTNADSNLATVTVLYDGERIVNYEKEELAQLDHAYAVTVHKSQGSEFSTVIIPLFPVPPMLATRSVIYTAVTRGKSKVVLIGREHVLRRMVEYDTRRERYTGLRYFLEEFILQENLF